MQSVDFTVELPSTRPNPWWREVGRWSVLLLNVVLFSVVLGPSQPGVDPSIPITGGLWMSLLVVSGLTLLKPKLRIEVQGLSVFRLGTVPWDSLSAVEPTKTPGELMLHLGQRSWWIQFKDEDEATVALEHMAFYMRRGSGTSEDVPQILSDLVVRRTTRKVDFIS